ncbi:DNA polymerase II large subunit [Candidatus Halobonum tyrrellensis]|uniref:DNA polymerase II large subunit n=1 Tax=Candidatus Halobonum tyrrellensis G22 TaxID=1324957 RepID=V4J2E6_9EURY|nr:DNA polymerase II large subunit [Candidatus Halobonum tyrrellensis]ESP89582.1 DNA polymerase type II, large subunit [Candidatus Halobonum tyrrellensis G22]
MRPDDERYFTRIEDRLDEAFERAEAARARGRDPATEIEIPVARDMADRVENILGIPGVAERVRELEGEMSREEAALELVTDFVDGTVGEYDSREGKIEGAVRTAVALLTEGVVAAPIEGIDRVELLENDDGTEFVNVYYAGPIRSAGGTAQALSVLVADYARSLLDVEEYAARGDEVERYAEEVALYDKETGLQYTPKDAEAKFIAEHMPIMLDGEATGDEEVSGFRDLERVDTNSARGGMCLVLAEGIALKAPKIQRYTRQLDEVEWPWLQDLIDGTYYESDDADDDGEGTADADEGEADDDGDEGGAAPSGPARVEPQTKFLRDLIAGRPVFGHPSEVGGFRLRYGRARNHGFATAGVHPATMHLVDDFLATGTQIKTERPGKAGGVVPVDSIEGPTVKLANGDVRRIDDPAEALEVRNGVEEIIDLGEYLVNYGEFVENNHPLAPASYVAEWWEQDLDAAGADVQALRDDPLVDLSDPDADSALEWAEAYDAPLHPAYTYCWHDVSVSEFEALADAAAAGEVTGGVLAVEHTDELRDALERLLVEHTQTPDALRIPDFRPLLRQLGVTDGLRREWEPDDVSREAREWTGGDNAVRAVNEVAPFEVRERAPTRVGNRMGRPEKSESRDLSPAVHTLFPIGDAGGSQRSVGEAASTRTDKGRGVVDVRLGERECPDCGARTYHTACPDCETHTEPYFECDDCGTVCEPDESGRVECPHCGWEVESPDWFSVDLNDEYWSALDGVGERESSFEILKGVKGLTSANKTPEPVEKGVLRAKHGVSAFKDGTVRYDMTDLPVTAVRPEELDVTAEHFRELGYETDIDGEPLVHDDQLVELKVQDIVLSDGAAEHMMRTADFVDDLLAEFYGLEPFYEVNERDDLVGELVFGMAPHTSAAVVGRVVGFTSAAVGYAHPYFHAAKRRNCFHPETKLWYRDETDEWHHGRIDEFVEDRLVDPDEDDFGTLVSELDGDVFVPSLTDEGEEVLKPVEAVSKHRAPEHMVRVETRSGREITVTPDHEMHVFDDGEIRSKRADAVGNDDSVVTPSNLDAVDVDGNGTRTFDLLAEFLRSDVVDDDRLMIEGVNKDDLYDLFAEALEDEWDGTFYPLESTAEHLGLSKKALSNYVYRERFPAALLGELFGSTDALLDSVPSGVKLGVKRDSTAVDRTVELDERVATLLGYYAAEGFAREQETPKGTIHQTTVCGTEAQAREFYLDVLREEFGVDPYRENRAKVTASGRLLRAFFDTVLDAGSLAETKRVPQCVFDAEDRIVEAYLSGYFSGDGTADRNAIEVSATTVSRELKEDLLALLTRLGIAGRASVVDPVPLNRKFPDYYSIDDPAESARSFVITVSSEDAVEFANRVGFHLDRKEERLREQIRTRGARARRAFDGGTDDCLVEPVASVEYVDSDTDHTYCLTVEGTHSLVANDLSQKQCDGDEDCVMLLMDGLLNFSKEYLPDKRGGRMDAPLVMSSRIDPSEIDDEAHNMDIVRQYPQEFYEATLSMADPEDVDIEIAEATLGTDDEYRGFDHTHDTSDIALGPDLSAYKTLGSMMDKMDAQLNLARKLRAVDETDVAERVIEYHFLPDLIGNLRAFSRQETRCLDCGEKYRRMPLTGDCRECGGRMTLTVHQGSVNKYMDTAIQVAEEFDCREYTKQRLEILDRSLESVFENDKNKQGSIADFM